LLVRIDNGVVFSLQLPGAEAPGGVVRHVPHFGLSQIEDAGIGDEHHQGRNDREPKDKLDRLKTPAITNEILNATHLINPKCARLPPSA
jgi:hypothetical protein